MKRRTIAHFSPARIIIVSLLALIALGTSLLSLPICQAIKINPLDAFFTATSAVTVTGLLPIAIHNFTPFGHFIIMILMQIGGLGLITLTFFLVSFFIELGFGTQLMAGQLLEVESWKNIKKIIGFIMGLTVVIELIGTCLIFMTLRHDYPLFKALFYSLFHSISAYCDAGFCLFPNGMIAYRFSYNMLITLSFLMMFGGVGFITLWELLMFFKAKRKRKVRPLALHAKIVLLTTFALTIISILLYWILEQYNTLESMPIPLAFLNSMFNAIASRSPGFTTVFITDLQMATLLIIMLIAFIGSAPGSTGSGIKTTTFALLIATVNASITGRPNVSFFGRTIPKDQVYKALAVIFLSLAWIFITIFCLLITEKTLLFKDIVFEAVSGFSTLGLSTGITHQLTATGKIFIVLSMIVGRVGALSFIIALRKRPDIAEYSYPEERIMVG